MYWLEGNFKAMLSNCPLEVSLLLNLIQFYIFHPLWFQYFITLLLRKVFPMSGLNPATHSFWPVLTFLSSLINKSLAPCFNILFTNIKKPNSLSVLW